MKIKPIVRHLVFWAIWICFALLYYGAVTLHSANFATAGLGFTLLVCLLTITLY